MSIFRRRAYKLYDVETFFETYKYGLSGEVGNEVFIRYLGASGRQKTFKVYDDEMEIILAQKASTEDFNRKLGNACCLNNEGLELEKAGDIAGAIAKYEENILPGTHFTLNPYHRLCVLYRRAGDYDNEIRVIETCLARYELGQDKERDFFEDRLQKAIKYREQHQQK